MAHIWVLTFPGYAWTPQISAFVQSMVDGGFIGNAGAEYGLQQAVYEGTVTFNESAPFTIDDQGIQDLISNSVSLGVLAPPTSTTLYLIFTPEATFSGNGTQTGGTVVFEDAAHTIATCEQIAAYHGPSENVPTPLPYAYGVIPDCGSQETLLGQDEVQFIEVGASHQVMATITDPSFYVAPAYRLFGTGPWAGAGGEVGDFCVGLAAPFGDGGDDVQRIWSNAAARTGQSPCLPAPSDGTTALFGLPYTVVGYSQASIEIPFMAWTTEHNPAVIYDSYGGSFFKSILPNTPPNTPTDGTITPYTLALPQATQTFEVFGRVVSRKPDAGMEAWWPLQIEVESTTNP